jgi:hypothetical protein
MEITPQPWRQLVGRPWKQLQATLILKKEIKKKNTDDVKSSKSLKIRTQSIYTNWFAPHLWPSIFAIVKKHCNFINILHYLKTFYKKPTEANGSHDKLSRGSLYAWFIPRGEIKPHLKSAIKKGTISMASKIYVFQFWKQNQNKK